MPDNYCAEIEWARGESVFIDGKYSRGHLWRFDGGLEVSASSAPSSVPVPYSIEEAVDPHEALVAAASSCHLLFFLAFAAKAKIVVDRYIDKPSGSLGRDHRGKLIISAIVLRPHVIFSPDTHIDPERSRDLHSRAHRDCYVANSLRTTISIILPPDTLG
jgi:organic hydroperoxide reductase OsmC/OhrA